MGETIPGGAYRRSDGVTWQDANGKKIEAPSAKELREAKAKSSSAAAPDEVKDDAEEVTASAEVEPEDTSAAAELEAAPVHPRRPRK